MINVDLEKEMEQSFLDYFMSVIISRALPDVRDGLKPVHRRILCTMFENGLIPEKDYHKCVDTVSAVSARYHLRGDTLVYDALVHLVQDLSMHYILADGHGDFGPVDGDPLAAYRYTGVRPGRPVIRMPTDIEKDMVDFRLNYDDRLKEPVVLPVQFPNILTNSSTGIAVGTATNIPPHNVCGVIDGLYALTDNPDTTTGELMEYIKGPDLPTDGITMGHSGVRVAYGIGRDCIIVRVHAGIEEEKNSCFKIVIPELPCQVSKIRLIETIVDLVGGKRVGGVSNIEDHSNHSDMHVVIDVKCDTLSQIVLNHLYTYTQMQITFNVTMLAIVDDESKTLMLKGIPQEYVRFRESVIMRRTQLELRKTQERVHILRSPQVAIDNIDKVVSIIRNSKSIPVVEERLMKCFRLDDIRTQAIAQMPPGRLTGLERWKLEDELTTPMAKTTDPEDILANVSRQFAIAREEALAVKAEFGDERRAEIATISGEVDIEDLIPQKECVLTMINFDYVRRQKVDTYHIQRHGGRGVPDMTYREEGMATKTFITNSHDYVLFFSNLGRVYRLECYEVLRGSRISKGINIVNLLPLFSGESVTSMICVPELDEKSYLVTVTRNGTVKRTVLSAYNTARKGGVIVIDPGGGDSLSWVRRIDGSHGILVAMKKGMSIRLCETDIHITGRIARDVRVITLKEGDCAIGLFIIHESGSVPTASETGYGRLSPIIDYRTQSRGGKGLLDYHVEKYGDVTSTKVVDLDDDVIIISSDDVIIRIHAASIRACARSNKGVCVMCANGVENCVTILARAPYDDEEETGGLLVEDDDSAESVEDLVEEEVLDEVIPGDEDTSEGE